jgi:DNA-binding response OmpR family regulator
MAQARTQLLVEDEPLVALAIQDTLEDAGYEVLLAADGHSGAAAIEENINTISGLITDIRLGTGPEGWLLARQARECRPELPVLYVTADSADDWSSQGVSGSSLLQKPFRPERMLAELHEILT